MKTLEELNKVLNGLNNLCDFLNEPRIPLMYAFNHDKNSWIIKNIYPKDTNKLKDMLDIVCSIFGIKGGREYAYN